LKFLNIAKGLYEEGKRAIIIALLVF